MFSIFKSSNLVVSESGESSAARIPFPGTVSASTIFFNSSRKAESGLVYTTAFVTGCVQNQSSSENLQAGITD